MENESGTNPHARAAVVFFDFQSADVHEEFHADLSAVAGAEVVCWCLVAR